MKNLNSFKLISLCLVFFAGISMATAQSSQSTGTTTGTAPETRTDLVNLASQSQDFQELLNNLNIPANTVLNVSNDPEANAGAKQQWILDNPEAYQAILENIKNNMLTKEEIEATGAQPVSLEESGNELPSDN